MKEVGAYETGYVVLLHKAFYPTNEIKKCFDIKHPVFKEDLNQFKSIKFTFKADTILHVFTGYFSSRLYSNVIMSIVPNEHSKVMYSWFPMYFPIQVTFQFYYLIFINIQKPIEIKANETLEILIWRINDTKKVWYEWSFNILNNNQNLLNSQIHNFQGQHYSIII